MSGKQTTGFSHKNLIRRLSQIKEEVEAGTIFLPDAPIPLESPLDLAAAGRLGLETILFFDWAGEDNRSWFRRLAFIPLAARSAAVTWEGGQGPLQIIARLSPAREPEIWAYFLHDFLANNGREYGVTALEGVPARITVYRPLLVPEAALRAGLRAFLEQASGWPDLATFLAQRDAELPATPEKEELLDVYFACCYVEVE